MFPILDFNWEENTTRWKWNCYISETELLKMQKRGQFPDEPVKIKDSQIFIKELTLGGLLLMITVRTIFPYFVRDSLI
jgi:hypothetical protein